MPEVVVVGFKANIHRASGVLDELRVLDDKWIRDLSEAVALHRQNNGLVKMDQTYKPTGRRASDGGGTIGLLIGASLSIPYLEDSSQSVSEGVLAASGLARIGIAGVEASFWNDTLGIRESFFEQAGQVVLPGDSAIFAMLEVLDSGFAATRFQRYGGTILSLSISDQQQMMMQRLIKDSS